MFLAPVCRPTDTTCAGEPVRIRVSYLVTNPRKPRPPSTLQTLAQSLYDSRFRFRFRFPVPVRFIRTLNPVTMMLGFGRLQREEHHCLHPSAAGTSCRCLSCTCRPMAILWCLALLLACRSSDAVPASARQAPQVHTSWH